MPHWKPLAAILGCSIAWLLGACSDSAAPAASPPMQGSQSPGQGLGREQTLGPFLAAHWQLPVPGQGSPPGDFSPLEASLEPGDCGSCHPTQLAQWRTSRHAGAFSPGFAGQLLEGSLAATQALRSCQGCHAPLAEQQPVSPAGAPAPHYQPALRSHGVVCAACHVRHYRRFGPPRRPRVAAAPDPAPHGGFEVRPEFEESRFCAQCHQFFDDEGVAGKPIQNTFVEWRQSPQAAAGQTCQSCHMPGRAHLWRGIHDAETVRKAVSVELHTSPVQQGRDLDLTLTLHSHGVGHDFPTYVTPRVYLRLWQEDAEGRELPDTRAELVIGRKIDFGRWQEVFDTRVLPGETATLHVRRARAGGATSVVGRVSVDPDFHYRGVYRSLLSSLEKPEARALIREALRRADAARYVLAERRQTLP